MYDGGGIYQPSYGGTTTLANTIAAENANGTSPDIYGTVTAHYCLIGDNRGSNLIEAPIGSPDAKGNLIGGPVHGTINPGLDLNGLNDNGGPTQTILLLAGSPAIDHGNNALAIASGVVADQRGLYRIFPLNGTVDIGAYEVQPAPATQDALEHQILQLSPATFDGTGNDITLALGDTVAGQQVEVLVGQTQQDLHSVGTFTNGNGDLPWMLSIDIAGTGVSLAQYVAVGSDKPVIILSAVGLHPNPSDLSGGGYQQNPVASEPQPTDTTPDYSQVAKLYDWDGTGFDYVQPAQWATSINWSKKTIILTHGWNDSLCIGTDGVTPDFNQEYIWTFAENLSQATDQYNILAIDWNGNSSPTTPNTLGSNPNGQDVLYDLQHDAGDLDKSAKNALAIGKWFADTLIDDLNNAGTPLNPANLMLIGHSNGAGLMASAAVEIKTQSATHANVDELDALDAPTLMAWDSTLFACGTK